MPRRLLLQQYPDPVQTDPEKASVYPDSRSRPTESHFLFCRTSRTAMIIRIPIRATFFDSGYQVYIDRRKIESMRFRYAVRICSLLTVCTPNVRHRKNSNLGRASCDSSGRLCLAPLSEMSTAQLLAQLLLLTRKIVGYRIEVFDGLVIRYTVIKKTHPPLRNDIESWVFQQRGGRTECDERCVYGTFLTKYFRSHYFRCLCPLRHVLEETRSDICPRGCLILGAIR